MKRNLLILRHGKSDWRAQVDDFHRPLKNRGKRGAQRIGTWLLQQSVLPELIISSPAERALTTAQKCCKAMNLGTAGRVQTDDRVYMGDISSLLTAIRDCPPAITNLMIVGHNPGLEWLVTKLIDNTEHNAKQDIVLPTATLAWLTFDGDWGELDTNPVQLEQLVTGRLLPEKFPFPAPNGNELRDRPAYYYTQSSVIPYRVHKGVPEVMIIRSSKNKHWVVPKGIADPGMSKQDSAKKEAREEAGIEGHIDDAELGSYCYEKWGSHCTVTVYAMEVTHVLSEAEWDEDHRGRRWVSVADAESLLKQSQLVPMLRQLEHRLQQ